MEQAQPRTRRRRPVDKYGPRFFDKTEHVQDRAAAMKATLHGDERSRSQPAGGFDSTPYPYAPPGYTVKFTFHRGVNLPCADFGTFSSDPYVHAQLIVDLPQRHKQDPVISFRTPTVRKNRDPVWEKEWIVANVPASGFQLKCNVYDEDATDHDDKLGNAYVEVDSIDEDWPTIKEQSYRVKKRLGSKRVYLFGNIAALASRRLDVASHLVISIECLGKTPGDEGAHMYTVGPNYWFKHFSPLIGRLAGTKDEVQSQNGQKTISRYNFQAIQIQFKGPVPAELYHRYVEFKPFVAGMFTSHSLRGRILNRALHHQHERIYNFDKTTLTGQFASPCVELTQKFLEFVHYAQGGRIFTYVITLDGQFRFTETGKEFGIDLLSKHTMHSNVSIYIAYSGEFFLRRRKHRHHRQPDTPHPSETCNYSADESQNHLEISADPADYELFIDNDSGTYRPNAEYLPLLKQFISSNLNEQREFKKHEGNQMIFLQRSNSSSFSLSSSDEEDLNERSDVHAPRRARGDLAHKVHEMRDVKGHLINWAQGDDYAGSRSKAGNSAQDQRGFEGGPVDL